MVQRKNTVLVAPSPTPGVTISYVQLSGVKANQSEARGRRAGEQDRILGVTTSLLMQIKLVGKFPPWSSAHSRPAKQMDTIELAQFCACARRCAARAPTTKATAPATTSASKQIIERRTRMRRRAAYKSADKSSFFTSANLLMANSRSSREWAAETCVRMRALPFGTTG